MGVVADDRLTLWDTEGGLPRGGFSRKGTALCGLDFSPDGHLLAVGTGSAPAWPGVAVWELPVLEPDSAERPN